MNTKLQALLLSLAVMVSFCSAGCDTEVVFPPPTELPLIMDGSEGPLQGLPDGLVAGRLEHDPTPAPDDAFEENDDRSEAAEITAGTYALEGLDADWFSFEAAEVGMLSVAIHGLGGDLDLNLYDDAGGLLTWSSSTGSHEEVELVVPAGRYYVRIDPHLGAVASYTMRVEFTPWSPWGYDVNLVSIAGYGSDELTGDLTDGDAIDLSWATTSAFCFTDPMASSFSGHQVFYALENPQPRFSRVTVTVTPDSGVDVSVYGYQIGTTDYSTPPGVASVTACEEGHDDPSGTESFSFIATTNEYNVFFAIAGDGPASTSGGYTVEVSIDPL